MLGRTYHVKYPILAIILTIGHMAIQYAHIQAYGDLKPPN